MKAAGRCSSCAATLPIGARFCPSCGQATDGSSTKASAIDSEAPQPAGSASTTTTDRIGAEASSSAPSVPSPREALEAVSKLKRRKGTAVGIGLNVLTLVAVVFAFVVIMVRMTKDAPKSVSPFQGGPAPGSAGSSGAKNGEPSQGGSAVIGTIELDPGLAGSDPRGTLFITLRPAGSPPVGPPLAVQRLEGPKLPATFRVGPENVMLQGMPFSGPFDVYARLDGDGNAMTKDPTDLEAPPQRGVAAGASLVLVLGGRAEVAPEPGSSPVPVPPPAATGSGLGGEIRVSDALASSSGRGTLYIMVRNAGVPGPPVAVKRISDPSFPARFDIGPGDVMLEGTALVGPFDLSARLDQDGDPMTKTEGDLVSRAGPSGVTVGNRDVVIVLDQRL